MAIRVTVMSKWAPVRRVPIVFSLDEKLPVLETNNSLSSSATVEMNWSRNELVYTIIHKMTYET